MDFRFTPVAAPADELVSTYGDVDTALTFEVIDHLGQLARALALGSIGFEYYTALAQIELTRVGWSERD